MDPEWSVQLTEQEQVDVRRALYTAPWKYQWTKKHIAPKARPVSSLSANANTQIFADTGSTGRVFNQLPPQEPEAKPVAKLRAETRLPAHIIAKLRAKVEDKKENLDSSSISSLMDKTFEKLKRFKARPIT